MVVHVTCMGEVTAASAHRPMEVQTVKVSKNYESSMTQASKRTLKKKKIRFLKGCFVNIHQKGMRIIIDPSPKK